MSRDPYHEHEDRLLLEEHAAHPERFHKVKLTPTSRPSPSYPGYFVSRDGVITNRRGKVIRQFADTYGSLKVTVDCPDYKGSATVARMVGEVFCRGFDKKLRAFYRDGNKANCCADNLIWVPVGVVAKAPYSKNARP